MDKFPPVVVLAAALGLAACSSSPDKVLRNQIEQGVRVVELPPGIVEIHEPLEIPLAVDGLEIVGTEGSVLKAADDFRGRAMLHFQSVKNVKLRNFKIDGNRQILEAVSEIPPSGIRFSSFFQNIALLFEGVTDLEITNLEFENVVTFPILIDTSERVKITNVKVTDSGSNNGRGRNNSSGGILLEEGANDFQITGSAFTRIRGNGVWTHSRYQSPRSYNGLISNNTFDTIGRDAIQVGHANSIRVENNTGKKIGYPLQAVDVNDGAIPVAIDTAGKVDESIYTKNTFTDINGKCIDLDGFHDGEVSENQCINTGNPSEYPQGQYALVMNNASIEMESQNIVVRDNTFDGTRFGGIFVIGSGHTIRGNKLLNINKAQCPDSGSRYGCTTHQGERPKLLESGIYLALRAERPAPANNITIENNTITGHGMAAHCVFIESDPRIIGNTVRNNSCSNK